MNINSWLNDSLIAEIKRIFEPRYNRSLTQEEIQEIAEGIVLVMEQVLKFKWKEKYGKGL